MKRIQTIAVAVIILAIGSAFASKYVAHKDTLGQYWDPSQNKCVDGQTPRDCRFGSIACTDINTGIQLADGTSSMNPCGNLLFHN
jgi:hypothetical protein